MKKAFIILTFMFVLILASCKKTTTTKKTIITVGSSTIDTVTTTTKENTTTKGGGSTTVAPNTTVTNKETTAATTTTQKEVLVRTEGKGSIEDPYTIAEIAEVLDGMALGVYLDECVYVKGICQQTPAASADFNVYFGDTLDASVTVISRKTNLKEGVILPEKGDEMVVLGYMNRFESPYYTTSYMFVTNDNVAPVVVSSSHPEYDIIFDEMGENYTLINLPASASNKSTVEFSVDVNEGYAVKSVKVNGSTIQASKDGSYSFTVMGPMNVDVEVESESNLPVLIAKFGFNWDEIKNNGDGVKASEFKETVNGIDLEFNTPTMTFVYTNAQDGMGNHTLKLGKSDTGATFKFTVTDDTEYVIIRAAKYKAKDSKITVNGVEHVLVSSSSDGLYDEIIVDTTTVKTVEVSTPNAQPRCFILSIEYYKKPVTE